MLPLAAEAADPINILLQYGALGVMAAFLLVYTKGSIQRERERADRAEAQIKELNEFIRGELLPKQIEATLVYKQVAEVLGEAVSVISEVKILDRNERRRGV